MLYLSCTLYDVLCHFTFDDIVELEDFKKIMVRNFGTELIQIDKPCNKSRCMKSRK